jgi:hypothetical protein
MAIPSDSLIIWTGIPTDRRGASESCWVSIGGGQKAAIGKRNNAANGNGHVLYNELICFRIAQELELPIADSFVHKGRGEAPFFVQLNFNSSGDMPPAVDAAAFVAAQPQVSAQVVAFDILVINTDRHAGNLAYLKRPDGDERVFVFDHSHALFGGAGHQPGTPRLKRGPNWLGCDGAIGNRHCLLPHLTDAVALDEELERIQELKDSAIGSAVSEARRWGLEKADCNVVRATLEKRRDAIRKLVAANHASFPGIIQWSLHRE